MASELTVSEVREKWNRRYQEKPPLAGPPEPNPLARRFAGEMGGGVMLDAACGLGAGLAAGVGRYRRAYGVDISDQAIRAARQAWGNRPDIQWIIGDVGRMRWPEGGLDLVCAFGFTDWDFLARVPGYTAPGGLVLYQGFSQRERENRPRLSLAWTSTVESIAALFPRWEKMVLEESDEPPYRISLAARKPR